MAQTVREVMTDRVVTVPSTASLMDASRAMADHDIGDVIVVDDGNVSGIVTDRDIVVRAIAKGSEPKTTRVSDVLSGQVQTLGPDASIGDAVRLMTEGAIRRIPVVEGGRPIGIVSIGDLAVERDADSALADISAANPNN
jgi:CBS domain-containing protein